MTRDHIALAAQYQADVLAGTIPACRWVRLACERNRKDLDRQGSEGFPFHFDADAGRRICQFAELLPHIRGPLAFTTGQDDQGRSTWNTLTLEPWQCWLLSTLFGWKRADGLRRFRVGLILVPRKNGKSVLGAIVALYMFAVEGGSGSECYSAATTRDQAKIVAEIAWEMASRSPQFREHFGIRLGSRTTRTLTIPANAAKFAPLSADSQSLDGLNVLLAVIDELHAHKTRGVWDVLDTATGAQLQPLLLAITTAGVEIGGICHEKLGYLEKILDGVAADEAFFGVNWTIDSGPHTDKIGGLPALLKLRDTCTCDSVPAILIEQSFQKACAKHATTDGIANIAGRDVQSIRIDQSRPAACATSVTTNGTSRGIQNTENVASKDGASGPHVTEQSATRPTRDTERSQKTDSGSKNVGGISPTESPQSNTTGSWSNNQGCVQSANDPDRICTSITAIAAARFGDYFARNATAQSVFSETLRTVYSAHSPTCAVKEKTKLLPDGGLQFESPGDDVRDPIVQRKANPNHGVSVQADDLERKIAEAQHSPAALNNVLTKHFNVWIRTEAGWMGADLWQSCAVKDCTVEALKGSPCWIGVDLGETRDPSALALLFKLPDGKFALVPRIYMPAETIARSPIAQLSGWVREGWIIETPGSEADYGRIRDDLMAFVSTLQVQEIDFDRRSARLMMQDMRAMLEPTHGRDRVERLVVDVPQSLDTMDPAMKTTESLVLGQKLQHDGNPAMGWMITNVVVERNHKGEIYPRKAGGKDSWNKIDGPVAFFTALSRARLAPDPEPAYQFFTVGGRR